MFLLWKLKDDKVVMLKLKTLCTIPLLFLISCSAKYGVEIQGTQVKTSSINDSINFFNADPFVLADNPDYIAPYASSGNGFEIGLTAHYDYIFYKVKHFKYSMKDSRSRGIVLNAPEGPITNLKMSGTDIYMGVKYKFLAPYFFVGLHDKTFQFADRDQSSSYAFHGFGLDLEYDISKRHTVYVGYSDISSKDEDKVNNITEENETSRYYLGYRFSFN